MIHSSNPSTQEAGADWQPQVCSQPQVLIQPITIKWDPVSQQRQWMRTLSISFALLLPGFQCKTAVCLSTPLPHSRLPVVLPRVLPHGPHWLSQMLLASCSSFLRTPLGSPEGSSFSQLSSSEFSQTTQAKATSSLHPTLSSSSLGFIYFTNLTCQKWFSICSHI